MTDPGRAAARQIAGARAGASAARRAGGLLAASAAPSAPRYRGASAARRAGGLLAGGTAVGVFVQTAALEGRRRVRLLAGGATVGVLVGAAGGVAGAAAARTPVEGSAATPPALAATWRAAGHTTRRAAAPPATAAAPAGQAPAGDAGLRLPPPTDPDAVAHLQAGRVADALAALDAAAAADARTGEAAPLERTVLRAVLLARADRPAEAEAAWRTVIERAVFLRTFARRALVESLAGRGAPAAAQPVLRELTRDDAARHRDLTLRVAEAFRTTDLPDRAAALYRTVIAGAPDGRDADTARLGLAAAQAAAGDRGAALATLRTTQLRHRTADAFVAARQADARLRDGAPPPPFAEADYRRLVRRLRSASRFTPALALLDEWAAAFPAAGAQEQVAAERIATLYAQRDNAAAAAACDAFLARWPASARGPEVRLTAFRLAVRTGDLVRGRRLGLDLWAGRVAGATRSQRRGAGVLLAAVLVATGDLDGGLALYRGLFAAAATANDQRAMLWRAGVAALRAGQLPRARTNLEALVARGPDGDLALAAQYWLGVVRARQGEADAAVRTLEPLAARVPYHYYGLAARERLTALDRPPAPPPRLAFPRLGIGAGIRGRAEFRAAMTLARAGLTGDAAWYLRRLLGRTRGEAGLALLAARAASRADDHASAARVLFTHFPAFFSRPGDGLPDDFLTMAFPRPFREIVDAAAAAHGADPVLLLALMRRESRFDPDARSAVGAVGLLQVMPYVAAALAERAGVGQVVTPAGVDDRTLADPAVNIAIAARLNGDLLALFDGARLPVIASYNAGEDRAGDWWAAARGLRDDLFIDSIPYGETRAFTREVVANYAAYTRIYGDR